MTIAPIMKVMSLILSCSYSIEQLLRRRLAEDSQPYQRNRICSYL